MFAILEFIPLVIFFFVSKSYGVVEAAGALMVSMVVVSAINFVKQGYNLKNQQWFLLWMTIIFCSLTLLFRDDVFIKWKTPIINWLFASVLLLSIVFKKTWLQNLGGKFLKLTPQGWIKLTWVFVGYFVVLGLLHYVFAFYFPEDVWIDFKVIWASVISFVFMGGVMFSLRNYIDEEAIQKLEDDKKNDKKNDKNK